jgi:thiol-disulfide isomerase/thioredoxin
VCRQYEPQFQALSKKFPQVRFGWVDVEDQEALVGDVDVETFPTLLIGHGDHAMFLGPLLPQVKVLERLLQSLMDGQPASSLLPVEANALWQRIAGHLR